MKVLDELMDLLKIDLAVIQEGKSSIKIDEDGNVVSTNNLGYTPAKAIIKKRRQLIKPVKDKRKSSAAKAGWRSGRYNKLKGMRAYAKSVEGKRFHRKLGAFIANRKHGESLDRYESSELVGLLSSYRTHALIDLQYYKPLYEEIDYFNSVEEVIDIIDTYSREILECVFNYDDYAITEEFYDTLIRILETSSIVKSFAQKSGKTEADVESLWDKAKEVVTKEYNKTEDDENFYSLVVGVLKKMLSLD